MSSSDFNGPFRKVAKPTLKCGGRGLAECNPALEQLNFRHIAALCIVALEITQRTCMKRTIGGEFYRPPTVEELVRLHPVDCNTMLSLALEADAFQAHLGSMYRIACEHTARDA